MSGMARPQRPVGVRPVGPVRPMQQFPQQYPNQGYQPNPQGRPMNPQMQQQRRPPPQMTQQPPRGYQRPPPMSQMQQYPQQFQNGYRPPQSYGQPYGQRIPPQQMVRKPSQPAWDNGSNSESSGTANEDTPQTRAGPAGPNPNVPAKSYALLDDKGERTNLGNTAFVMSLLSEMWILNLVVLAGGTYLMNFGLPIAWTNYTDTELWNISCFWKLPWILPLPYTLICFWGLVLPFRTPKYLYDESLPKRRVDNLYILTVTKGDNRDAVYRSWNAHKHLERYFLETNSIDFILVFEFMS